MYRLLRAIVRLVFLVLCGLDVSGLENVPQQGGAIIAGTHTTMLDPVAIAIAIKRPLHFMGKAELFQNPLLRFLFTRLNAFPVRRGLADREAIRIAQERVSAGHLLGIFPEGTRNTTEEDLLPLQGGATLIAIKTGVPVVPVVVSGFRPFRLRRPLKVVFGRPIDLGGPRRASKAEVLEGTKAISAEFSYLLSRNNKERREIQ
jgi:1-acyl-sn-glycerol-3-phosphate acyltransferase